MEAIWDHSGWIVDTLAKNLSALVIFAEHRFFGGSFPFTDTVPYLPSPQSFALLTFKLLTTLFSYFLPRT